MKFSKTLLIIVCGLCYMLLCGCEQAHIKPPLTLSMRKSAVRGVVLQITNRATEHLECSIYAISADRKKEQEKQRKQKKK